MICKRGFATAAAMGAAGALLATGTAHAAGRPESVFDAVEIVSGTVADAPGLHVPVVHGPVGHVPGLPGHGLHVPPVQVPGVHGLWGGSGGNGPGGNGPGAEGPGDHNGGGDAADGDTPGIDATGDGTPDVPGAAVSGSAALRVDPVADCDPVTGTALITVDHTGHAPADVLLTVRFESGLPGPRLDSHHFAGAGRHTFHAEWLPGGQYDVYLDAAPPAGAPAATVATPHVACTVHPTGSADAVDASADVDTTPGTAPSGGTLAHTGAGAVGPLAAAGSALLLGAAAVLLTRRRREPHR